MPAEILKLVFSCCFVSGGNFGDAFYRRIFNKQQKQPASYFAKISVLFCQERLFLKRFLDVSIFVLNFKEKEIP